MAIGVSDKHRIYIVKASNEPPVSSSYFTDYTNFFTEWRVKGSINGILTFEGVCVGINTSSRKLDIAAGSSLYLMSGTKLVAKFTINKPIYESEYKVRITANQSTGTEITRKKLSNCSTKKVTFKQESIDTVLFGTGSLKGVCVDSTGAFLIKKGGSPGSERVSVSFDEMNRMNALQKACRIAQKEYEITYGANDATPFSDGDILWASDRVGSATPVKTFILRGVNKNASVAKGGDDEESSANHIIIQGTDINGRQISSEIYDATNNKTYLSATLDGWLEDNISAGAATIDLKSGHGFAGQSGGWFFVKIDSEVIKCQISGNQLINCVRGTQTSTGMTKDTTPSPHKAGSDVVIIEDKNTSDHPRDTVRVYVDSTSYLPSSGTIKVGSETMQVWSKSSGYVICERIYALEEGGWGGSYAHSEDMVVFNAAYTPDNPNTPSSIRTNGLHSITITENSSLTHDSLDKKALRMLESRNQVKRISVEVSNPIDVWGSSSGTPTGHILLGDNAVITEDGKITGDPLDTININAGTYRIMEFEYMWPPAKLTLFFNDQDTRAYGYGDVDFVASLDESFEEKRQDATRYTDDKRYHIPDLGEISGWSPEGKIPDLITDDGALDPFDTNYDYDAANVKFVKDYIGGSGPGGLWTDNVTEIYPFASRNVVPFTGSDPSNLLGTDLKRWYHVYGNFGSFIASPPTDSDAVLTTRALNDKDGFRAGWLAAYGWNFRVSNAWTSVNVGPLVVNTNASGTWGLYTWDPTAAGNGRTHFYQNIKELIIVPQSDSGFDGSILMYGIADSTHAVLNVKNTGANDALRAGYLAAYGWNFRVANGQVGIYNGLLNMHNEVAGVNHRIVNMEDPISAQDAATKAYVDANAGVWYAGSETHGVTTYYWVKPDSDRKVWIQATGDNVLMAGKYAAGWDQYNFRVAVGQVGIYNGALNMHSNKIIDLGTPTTDYDAATKKYVDDNVGGYWGLSGNYVYPLSSRQVRIDYGLGVGETGDAFRAAQYSSGNYNFRVSIGFVGIYNGPLSLSHNGGIQSIRDGSGYGIWMDTVNHNDGWKIYGSTNNLIFDHQYTTAELEFREHVLMYGTGPSKDVRFGNSSVRIYRDSNDLKFEDINCNGGSPVTLSDLFAGGGAGFWTRSSSYLYPATSSDGVRITTSSRVGLEVGAVGSAYDALRAGQYSSGNYNLRVSNGYVAIYNSVLDMTSHKIVNLATPTTDYDAATKKYVDDHGGGGVGTLQQVLAQGNSAGSYDINMNYQDITNIDTLTGNVSTMYIENVYSGGDIRIEADEDLRLYGDGGSVGIFGEGGQVTVNAYTDIYLIADYGDVEIEATDGDIDLIPGSGDDVWFRSSNTGSRLSPYYDCTNDLGASNYAWDDVYAYDLNDNYCDVAELQFVSDDVQEGDIVELGDWDSNEEKEFFEKEVEWNAKKNVMNPNKSDLRYVGLQGKWKKAVPGSTRCPSVVSLRPGIRMGSNENRVELYKTGKMKYIALSGSVPFVYVEGKFKSGDILVSAGNGHAKADNKAPWNQIIGYVKRSGADERCEIWVK